MFRADIWSNIIPLMNDNDFLVFIIFMNNVKSLQFYLKNFALRIMVWIKTFCRINTLNSLKIYCFGVSWNFIELYY